MEEFVKNLGIKYKGNYSAEGDSYVIDLPDSDTYGMIYMLLENSNIIDLLDENQLVTEEGSSLLYQAIDEPYLVNLLADWQSDKYQLVINDMGE